MKIIDCVEYRRRRKIKTEIFVCILCRMGCGSKRFRFGFYSRYFSILSFGSIRYCFIFGFIFGRNMTLFSFVLLFCPFRKCQLGLDVADCTVRLKGVVCFRARSRVYRAASYQLPLFVSFFSPAVEIRLIDKPKWLM